MPQATENTKRILLRRLAASARRRERGASADRLARFVELFFAQAAPADVLALDEETLLGSALSAWRAVQSRRRGTAVVRVFNPCLAEDGFRLAHTLVEMVNDDMPFLVNSVTAELNRANITVHLVIHPIVCVQRDQRGTLTDLCEGGADGDAGRESVMHLHIDQHSGKETLAAIGARLLAVLADVRAAVDDWKAMRQRVDETIGEIESTAPPVGPEEVEEVKALLRWLRHEHFMFLGYRDYRVVTKGRKTRLEIEAGSGLGILRSPSVTVYEELMGLPHLPDDIAEFLHRPELLMLGRANLISTVERPAHLDTFAFRRFDTRGRVVGGRLFAGLFTSIVYTSPTHDIPIVRRKVDAIVEQTRFDPRSHDGRGLLHVLETLPREELFHADTATLLETSLGVLRLRERQRLALFVHRDPFRRYLSCLVYTPRDRFDTRLRLRLAAILAAGFDGTITTFSTSISADPLARIQFNVLTVPGVAPPCSVEEVERRLVAAARDWRDELRAALVAAHGEERGLQLLRTYADAFASDYRERYDAAEAVADIARIGAALAADEIVLDLRRPAGAAAHELRLKLCRRDRAEPLSDVLPLLENMGLRVIDEIPHRVAPHNGDRVAWIHDFGLVAAAGEAVDLAAIKALFEEALLRVWRGDTDNDGFNALVLAAGLSSRCIEILRTYCRFLLQTGILFSQSYMEATLARHAGIARRVVELFETLFDPARREQAERDAERLLAAVERDLQEVVSPDEDRILRRFVNAVSATLRTNYYQRDAAGAAKPYLSIKLDSHALEELPLPRPLVEVFVSSPRVEAVHLRGGKVARGGIRWSDRREDFRTEVLGLMKAQMTKNAVIVPVGAKGGFVVKRPPSEGGRDAAQREAVECYQTFMRGLLDLTDNIVDGAVVPPADVVRRDGDDPYLVVAADKGTASFSNIANAVAAEYGFWLGDAFASGGSAGYDHKAMGITARGAWESIKRHFREMGVDPMKSDFTCVGVGDMSGDVFGNGALYTRHMRLVAAFNHQHIFVDPSPDAVASYRERKRLFALPRSAWTDYDRKLISRGGGVFERSAKAIPVSEQMRKLFALGNKATATPTELIRAILACDVDLLFFGGIGTYVRATHESNAEVGDRANDALRVTGRAVGAKIIGEGANLAITQRGRVEYALAGGRINADFIDNSAGVDCSDHEVNIKILLGPALADGTLRRAARDKLLAAMTNEVAALVLRDNYRQSNALSEAQRQSVSLLDDHTRFLASLERAGHLDRAVEFLPDKEEIDERRAEGKGLTRPELAVLLAYAKIVLQEEVLASPLPDDPHLTAGLPEYFPKRLRRRFAALIQRHRLRRDIIATYVANTIVNRMGPGFVTSVQERTGAPAAEVARSYLICRQVFRAGELWLEVDGLDDVIPAALQAEMRLEILELIKRGTSWFLRNGPQGVGIDAAVSVYAPAVAALEDSLENLLPEARKEARDEVAQRYVAGGAPPAVARRIADLDMLTAACDIVRLATLADLPPAAVARVYYGLGARLGIDWLRDAGSTLVAGNRWHKAAALGLIDDLYAVQTSLTAKAIGSDGGVGVDGERLAEWLATRGYAVDRLCAIVAELRGAPAVDLPMLTVAAADMRALVAAEDQRNA